MNDIYALLDQISPDEPLLEHVKETLRIIVSPADTKYSYIDLYPYVAKEVPEEKRRIHELLCEYGYNPELKIIKNKLILELNKCEFIWCKKHLKILSAGWLYLLYSEVLKVWKIGMTESTMVRRMSNYRKDERWKVLHIGFCKTQLQLKEHQLKAYCESRYLRVKGDEHYNLEGEGAVEQVKEFIDFLSV